MFAAPAKGVWLAMVSLRSLNIKGIDNLPSTSHGKVTLSRESLTSDVQERNCESNLAAGSRRDETCGVHVSFLSAPVGRKGVIVAVAARVENFLGERELEGSTLRETVVGQLLERCFKIIASHEHAVEHTQVLPFARKSLAVDLDIAGASTEDAATACAPRRRTSNISFVPNIVMAVITAAENRQLIGLYRIGRKPSLRRLYLLIFLMRCNSNFLLTTEVGAHLANIVSFSSAGAR